MNFTDAQITKFAQNAEEAIAFQIRCIKERLSLAVISGISEYTLPDTVLSIERITWLGKKLDPYSGKEVMNSGSAPDATAQGHPRFYQFSDKGFRRIKLFPTPGLSLAQVTGDLWSMAKIESGLVIQYAARPDFTTTTTRVPAIIRRMYVKDYVVARLLGKEGKAMDPAASAYFEQKFKRSLDQHVDIWNMLHNCIDREQGPMNKVKRIGRPILPPQFGEVCE